MKTLRRLAFGLGLFTAVSAPALATDGGPANDPQRPVDPAVYSDSAPDAVLHPDRPLTQEQITEINELQHQADEDKNWLTLSYDQQLKNRTSDNLGSGFNKISSDRDLAKLAGLTPAETPATPAPAPDVKPKADSPATPSPTFNPAPIAPESVDSLSKPLLAPLTHDESLHGIYDQTPASTSADPSAPTPPAKTSDQMEVPGLTAAEMGAAPDAGKLTLELPEETTSDEATYNPPDPLPNNAAAPTEASSGTADSLIKAQDAKLQAPGSTPNNPVTVKAAQPAPEENQMIEPVGSPLRLRVSDPRQIPFN